MRRDTVGWKCFQANFFQNKTNCLKKIILVLYIARQNLISYFQNLLRYPLFEFLVNIFGLNPLVFAYYN